MKKGCYAVTVLRCYGSGIRVPPNSLTANTLTACLRALGVVLFIAIFTGSASATDVYRFLDTTTAPVTIVGINGVFKRALSPFRTQEVFDLPVQTGAATLSFSIGQQPVAAAGTVRFEIEFERGDRWLPLYQKDLSEPGWVDERVALPADLGKTRLRFRRKLLSGPVERAQKSAFGDPVLLPAEPARRPSVILISLDTLRADRLGLAGHKNARTPVLDAFAKSGVWYTDAYSPSAWTLPSHASLLYGRSVHSIPSRPLGTPTKPYPLAHAQSLAEILRASGYLTAGFTGGGYLSPNFGFERGFDTYFSFPQLKADKWTCAPQRFDGPEVFRRGTAWLRDRGSAPFFLFLHTYDVHDRCPFQEVTKGRDAIPWDDLDDTAHARLLAYYDDLIAETDTRVGALLAEIDALGLRDNTIIVITSDHGELFNEHGERGHGCKPLYEPLIRVPLLIRYPARLEPRAPGRAPVGLVDVAPTILNLLGLPQPDSMTGAPLPGFGAADTTRPVLAACDNDVVVRQGGLKLIATKDAPDRRKLFDLTHDPGETDNLFTARHAEMDPLLGLAEQHWAESLAAEPKSAAHELDAETRERLRALGYEP